MSKTPTLAVFAWERPPGTTPHPGAGMDALQLDLTTLVGRLQQVQDEGGWEHACPIVLDRILTCDLPRLREHLTPEAVALLDASH